MEEKLQQQIEQKPLNTFPFLKQQIENVRMTLIQSTDHNGGQDCYMLPSSDEKADPFP